MGFVSSIFSPPKPKAPPPPPPPKINDPAIEEERKRAREAERRRKGISSTILTSGQGEDEGALNIGTKTLLGQ